MARVLIGTSGFSYLHWRGEFYPENLPQKNWFSYYVKHFRTVELNVSFYRLPKRETFEKWRKIAGPPAGGFVFSVKGWRWITHIKRLKNCQAELKRFFEAANGLGGGVVLWQLPPSLKVDSGRLKIFLKMLPKDWRHAFEFRHESWLNKEIYDLLKRYNAAMVFQDFPDWPIPQKSVPCGTADFVYLRFHGKTSLYSSCYTEKELAKWAEKIRDWQQQGIEVYAYFNNDALGYAIKNAKELEKLCLKKN